MSWGIGATPSLDGDVHEQDVGDLDVGGLEDPRADLGLELVAALAAGQVLRGPAGDRVGDDVADDRLLRERAVALGRLCGRGLGPAGWRRGIAGPEHEADVDLCEAAVGEVD